MKTLSPELIPILKQLQTEGYSVATYDCNSITEYNSLYWFENGRIMNIQASAWRSIHNRDCYHLSVSYIPSQNNGSGCGLSESDWGYSASDLLQFRNKPTWVNGITNYRDLAHFMSKQNVLKFFILDKVE